MVRRGGAKVDDWTAQALRLLCFNATPPIHPVYRDVIRVNAGPKVVLARFDVERLPAFQSFELQPIHICKRHVLRNVYALPRVAVRHITREIRLITHETAFIISQGAQRAWKQVSPRARRHRRRRKAYAHRLA
jgi:hypothetical protein